MKHTPATASSNERRLADFGPLPLYASAIVGVAGCAIAIILGLRDGWTGFFRSYILNFAYVLSLALGALFFVLLQHLTRAGWSVAVRRLAEFVAATIPALALLFVPIIIPIFDGMREIYPWSDAATVHADAQLQWKQPYLNPPFFVARCAIYFAIWWILANFYLKRSLAQDSSGDVRLTLAMERWSGPAMLLYGLTVTVFAVDVLMSLAPHWFSTIFGVYYFAGGVVGFFALLALLMLAVQSSGRLQGAITLAHYHDIGKLVFGFVVFWAYIAYSQYMLIWYANLPEETSWYHARQQSGWWIGVSLLLLFGHFVVPFLLLISRWPKRRRAVLGLAAAWVLMMHWLDLYYLVTPTAQPGGAVQAGVPLHLTDFALLIGLGGLFAFTLLQRMRGRVLVPQGDPRLAESLAFENV